MKRATEAPVNGGRNYDGPKVNFMRLLDALALVKVGYLLESLSIPRYVLFAVSPLAIHLASG